MESKLLGELATTYQMDQREFIAAVKAQCFDKGACSDAQLLMLLSFAREYKLNPLAKECYAFVSGGKTNIGVQVDGWTNIANRNPDYDGQDMEFEYDKDGVVIAIRSKTYIKGRAHPVVYRAVMSEWYRDTPVWKSMPSHQLYVKARNMGIRFAFGIAAYDPDDLERIAAAQVVEAETKVFKEIVQVFPDAKPVAVKEAAVEVEVKEVATGGGAAVGESSPSPAPAAATLAEFLAAHDVPKRRLALALAKYGAEKPEDLTDEQQAAVLAVFQKSFQGGK